ncbi:MAG TPA: hypothetical protein VMC41_04465 [Candidatus Nanoarchaeia archaeon]|nr:hypothetical protein [Candidatus Nanoarchaeia archaeon]
MIPVMLPFRLKLRIAWITILAVAVFVLVWLAIIPSGKITYSTNFKGFNDFISQLTPKERIIAEKDGTQDVIGDPAYFSLRTSRPFNQAKLTIKFQVDPNLPIVEVGVSKDGRTWQYDLQPLYNGKLEELMKNWNVIEEPSPAFGHPSAGGDNLILLQRNKKFNSIGDFIKNPPAADKISLYNYDLKIDYLLPNYQPQRATSTMCRPLVGAYQFYTYIKNENLFDDFVFQDLNKNLDADPIDVYVYYRDKLIDSEHLDDDGIAVDSGAQKPWRHLKLDLANLPEGAYKIVVRANGDIVTRTITTGQSKMAFINTLPLADALALSEVEVSEVSCGRNFFTDGRTLSVQTAHPDKLGKIKIIKGGGISSSSEEINITQAYKIFAVNDLPLSGSEIILPNDGLDLSGDGLFSLSAEQMIDPRVKAVDANFNADSEGVDYVLARYTPPVKQGDWLVAQADFDLSNAFRMWNKYYFLISAPGLSADDQVNDKVRIKEIKVDLTGTSLWQKILKF